MSAPNSHGEGAFPTRKSATQGRSASIALGFVVVHGIHSNAAVMMRCSIHIYVTCSLSALVSSDLASL